MLLRELELLLRHLLVDVDLPYTDSRYVYRCTDTTQDLPYEEVLAGMSLGGKSPLLSLL